MYANCQLNPAIKICNSDSDTRISVGIVLLDRKEEKGFKFSNNGFSLVVHCTALNVEDQWACATNVKPPIIFKIMHLIN